MKKIYTLLAGALLVSNVSNAQLTLTKAGNEPVIGNVLTQKGYDSTSAIPKNTGMNQTWNFTSLVTNTVTDVSTFTTSSSTPYGSNYPSATMAQDQGGGAYSYIKTTASTYELLGFSDPNTVINYTNSAIEATWPVSYGYNNTDVFAGSAALNGTLTGSASGNITTQATGNGTLMLPGGLNFTSNILQVKIMQTINLNLAAGFVTATLTTTNWDYYHSSQKFAILSVSYSKTSGAVSNSSADIYINTNVLTGINDATLNSNHSIYPNPANDKVYVMLSNDKAEPVTITVINNLGQIVKTIDLGTSTAIGEMIDVSDLAKGIYSVRTGVGQSSIVKKLIVQ